MLLDVTNPITDWLFPRRCLICDRDLVQGVICRICQSLCHRCANPLFLNNNKFGAMFYFETIIKEIIKKAKFNKKLIYADLIMRLIKEELRISSLMEDIRQFSPEALTVVPTHWLNRLTRGMELPWLFAELLAKELKVPVISLLKRQGFKDRQALRSRKTERQQLIQGAFLLKSSHIRCQRLLLIDDIVTTGSTFNECRKVLASLARDIRCVAIAKTP